MIIRKQNLNKGKSAFASCMSLLSPEACKGRKGVSPGSSLTPDTPATRGGRPSTNVLYQMLFSV